MVKVLLPGSKKRRQDPPEILEGEPQKRRKMDHSVKFECGKILRTLMTHRFAGVFNQPIDPVDLGIPDYFDIISHPMDLGTINKKLDGDIYSLEAFAADVRLTFSNAMLYNPPKNTVHKMARELDDLFNRLWRSAQSKLVKPSVSVAEQGKLKKKPVDTSKICNSLPVKSLERKIVKKPSQPVSIKAKKPKDTDKTTTCSVEKPFVSVEEKVTLKKELMLAVRGELTGSLRWFFRKYGLINPSKDKIESAFSTFRDETLCDLRKVLKGSLSFATSMEKGKDDTVKTQRKVEVTERRKLEDKSSLESRIRAARAAKKALLEGAKSDLQMRRDKEREKVAKMQRTVIMDDNLTFLRELEKLCQYSWVKNPLEKIGLRLKEEYYYGYEYIDDDNGAISEELEDGEIF